MRNLLFHCFILLFIFSACKPSENGNQTKGTNAATPSMADKIMSQAVIAHGGEILNTGHYSFVFRKKQYTFKNNGDQYEYKMISSKDSIQEENTLNNLGLTRKVNGKVVTLDEKKIAAYSSSLNSVIYFATLPYKLKDPAVNKKYIGETTIKDQSYHILEITFNEIGGGRDHDDEFYYWINAQNNRIDYMAYNFTINNGGVRFRTAYNTRIVDGALFQDYVNYKADVGTPLADLPGLFEKDGLKKLSLIETEEVQSLMK